MRFHCITVELEKNKLRKGQWVVHSFGTFVLEMQLWLLKCVLVLSLCMVLCLVLETYFAIFFEVMKVM